MQMGPARHPELIPLSPLQAITLLTELIRENFRSSKLKQCLLPTLGQLIYLVATQVRLPGELRPLLTSHRHPSPLPLDTVLFWGRDLL